MGAKPWNTSGGQPVVFGLSRNPKPLKVQANLPRFPDGKWKHAVTHVPRVYAFGHGNTSSRTPLIILVFGEFGTFVVSSFLPYI